MFKKKLNLMISLSIGIILFVIILHHFGIESIKLIYQNINPVYFSLYIFFTIMVFFTTTLRLQTILKAYRKKIPFKTLLKQNIAGFSMAYITPSAKLGGEPLKAYMLKKECGVNIKTASSAIIIDKFVEILGTIFVGIIGLILLFLIPHIPGIIKAILFGIIIFGLIALYFIYYRTIKKKGSFSTLFNLLKFYKITKWKSLPKTIEDIEARMHKFFIANKKEFIISFLFPLANFIVNIIEFKFLFLSFGINLSITEIVLTIVVLGIVNFIPVPAALGFFEASQSGLFSLLRDSAGIGLAFSLVVRLRNVLFTIIGLGIISHFSGEQIINNSKNKPKT